jgi:predicted transposase YbfD/YdcC
MVSGTTPYFHEGSDTSICKSYFGTAPYLSSLGLDVREFARAVRGHWSIENGCHWTLDMTFREDKSRSRERNLREHITWLNRFALSLLKQHPGRQSVAMKRRSCGWSDAFLMEVVTGSIC